MFCCSGTFSPELRGVVGTEKERERERLLLFACEYIAAAAAEHWTTPRVNAVQVVMRALLEYSLMYMRMRTWFIRPLLAFYCFRLRMSFVKF